MPCRRISAVWAAPSPWLPRRPPWQRLPCLRPLPAVVVLAGCCRCYWLCSCSGCCWRPWASCPLPCPHPASNRQPIPVSTRPPRQRKSRGTSWKNCCASCGKKPCSASRRSPSPNRSLNPQSPILKWSGPSWCLTSPSSLRPSPSRNPSPSLSPNRNPNPNRSPSPARTRI